MKRKRTDDLKPLGRQPEQAFCCRLALHLLDILVPTDTLLIFSKLQARLKFPLFSLVEGRQEPKKSTKNHYSMRTVRPP